MTVILNGRPKGGRGRGNKAKDDDGEKKKKDYSLIIETTESREVLAADGRDRLTVRARVTCTDPEIATGPITEAIRFALTGADAAWVKMEEPRVAGAFRAVELSARPPAAEAQLVDSAFTLTLMVEIEGQMVHGPVDILLMPPLELEFA